MRINLSLQYLYCELFIRNYLSARYEYKRKGNRVGFENWVFSQIDTWGRTGNLSRDCVDSIVSIEEKYKYCKKIMRAHKNFKPGVFSLNEMGVKRISLHLMAHPCFSGFHEFFNPPVIRTRP